LGHEAQTERGEALPTDAWYAVWLRSNYEHVVREQLAAKGFETFLPQVRTWSRRQGTARTIRTPMFPGYLFVHDALDKRRYIDLLNVHGVVRVLEDGWTRLTPVPEVEIEAIQQIATADVLTFPCAHLQRGARVRVLSGPLAGVEGMFVQDKPASGRLVVSVDMLGRSIAVEMDGSDVEPCAETTAFGRQHAGGARGDHRG
jgi:transcription termination/antitermination protein NusG